MDNDDSVCYEVTRMFFNGIYMEHLGNFLSRNWIRSVLIEIVFRICRICLRKFSLRTSLRTQENLRVIVLAKEKDPFDAIKDWTKDCNSTQEQIGKR